MLKYRVLASLEWIYMTIERAVWEIKPRTQFPNCKGLKVSGNLVTAQGSEVIECGISD